MTNLELLKTAIQEGVGALPKNFLQENNIKAKSLGIAYDKEIGGFLVDVRVFVIEEDGELKDKVVYQRF